MLVDSTTSSLADDAGSFPPDLLTDLINDHGDEVDNDEEEEDDDGYSIVSRTSSVNLNQEGTTLTSESLMASDLLLLEKSIAMDDGSVVSVTSTTHEQPFVVEHKLIDHDDAATEFTVVDRIPTGSDDESDADRSTTVVASPDSKPKRGNDVMVFVLVWIVAMIAGHIMPNASSSSFISKLQNEINWYKEQLQTQQTLALLLQDEIRSLEHDALEQNEKYNHEIDTWKQKVLEMQAATAATSDQKESVQKLQDQVHQLLEEASAMEVSSNQETRRYQRAHRESQQELKRCSDVNAFQVQALEELSEMGEQCKNRKRKLKKDFNAVESELQSVKKKLRKETKALKDTTKEVKRQKKVILKLQKQLADIETKKAQARKEKKRRPKDTKFQSQEYTSTFTWDQGTTTSSNHPKSIFVDNCYMYLDAHYDFGECVYDMTDHVKDHFQTVGHTLTQSFQNAMKHLRQEIMEQYHPSSSSSFETSSKSSSSKNR